MKQILIVVFVLFFSKDCLAQVTIIGNLKSEKGRPISGASVIITSTISDDILDYAISDSKGYFSISINTKKGVLWQ